MVFNIINLEDRQVREIMIPRTMMFSLPAKMTVEKAFQTIKGKGFTRIPIYEDDKENIIGYIVTHDFSLTEIQNKSETSLKSIIRQISFVPEDINCLTMLTSFLKQRKHIPVVTDEFVGVDGLITLEDLLETVLGSEIVDETDVIVELQEAARKRKPGTLEK